jgi:hypothetical protein
MGRNDYEICPGKWRNSLQRPAHPTNGNWKTSPGSLTPQDYEDDINTLSTRLILEGADPEAVDIMCSVILVEGVSEEALTARIQSREPCTKYGGVKVVWRLLLAVTTKDGMRSHCCRLCLGGCRPEYQNAPDALRHLKRDHFGFSIACNHW